MRRVGGFLTCNDWNVENIWQLTCVKPIPDRYDFYCMPFVFRHIVRSPCYQQQVSHFNSSAASKAFSFRSRVLAFEISYDLCSRKVRMTSQIQIRYL